MTGASCALRTAPIVNRRSEPYSVMEMTLTGRTVVVEHRKHVELRTAVRYLDVSNNQRHPARLTIYVISKIFEYCILQRYEYYWLCSQLQFKFKKKSSCSHAIFLLSQ